MRINDDGLLEMDLVLRNNRTTEEPPLGIFHHHADLHYIKKKNISLIEVMGLSVLPAPLESELGLIQEILCGDSWSTSFNRGLQHHSQWIQKMIFTYGLNHSSENASHILKKEVGHIFKQVLEDAGVFKCNTEGCRQFRAFAAVCGFIEI